METLPKLYDIPLFADLPPAEVQWLIDMSHDEHLTPGDSFFEEGKPTDRFYVVLEGEMQVTRHLQGKQVVMGTTPRGIMGGEIALMHGEPSQVTSRAILTTRLMVFYEDAFRLMFIHAPKFAARVVSTAAERMAGIEKLNVQREKMAALGKLSAGLAHELNNPASAARRASDGLQDILHDLQIRTLQLAEIGLSGEQLQSLIVMQKNVIRHSAECPVLSPMEQADREDEIGDYLDELGVENSWEIAPVFVNAGLKMKGLQQFVATLPDDGVGEILNWVCVALTATSLLDEIANSTDRISDLVGAVKSYTYMDRAPTQQVDLNKNLINTLKVMNYKMRDINIVRELDPDLPLITARGGELNQVLTNIIDNAVDAMSGKGTLEITTRFEDQFIMMEITDSGPGIPRDILPHIFDPFFTTKGVGEGIGIGLDITYRIIQQHGGTIEVRSQPGRTRFIIRLPLENDIEES